jgi:hypothetical protein
MPHARRYFDEARKAGDSTHAKTALDFIGKLSLIERVLRDRDCPFTPAKRITTRQQQSAPIMAEFHAWLEALAPKVLPEGPLGKAVHYALGQWSKLSVFLTHGEVPLTNNQPLRECDPAVCPRSQRLALCRYRQGCRRKRQPVLAGRDCQG